MGLGRMLREWFSSSPIPSNAPVMQTAAFSGYSGWRGPYPVTDQLLNYRAAQYLCIDRTAALGVPAVLRARNLICSISTLPLQLIDQDNRIQDHPLFRQIDPTYANVTALAATIEDLFFDAVSWWKVTARTADGYPAKAVRYSPDQVSFTAPEDYQRGLMPSELPTEGYIYIEGKPVVYEDVIRFDSPNPAFLVAGERAIRRAILLDAAADLYATNRRMRGFFTPSDNTVDPASDDEIADMLAEFASAREQRLDGYIPAALEYNPIQDPTPAEIQIIAQQQRADLALANAAGIDPEDLGINTTSRTYQNATDRRKDRVNDVLSPYMRAITDRLSMPDVTKRGYTARFWLDDYLKADPKTRAEVQQLYVDMDVIDATDIQREEGLPPKQIEHQPDPAPAAPGTQVSPTSAIPGGQQ